MSVRGLVRRGGLAFSPYPAEVTQIQRPINRQVEQALEIEPGRIGDDRPLGLWVAALVEHAGPLPASR